MVSFYLKKGDIMLTLDVRSVNSEPLFVNGCPGINKLNATFSYLNYYKNELKLIGKKIFFENVTLCCPIPGHYKDDGTMMVFVGEKTIHVSGIFGELLVSYYLCNNYQRGFFCFLCRNRCQAEGLLEELVLIGEKEEK